ncbi:MAG: alpha-ketoacid dehydrogenase subunit beta [Planctomycetota bacterium]|jgi:2-oxoisovalerate dehydrogenase E1 component beta subunit|nr:alpha-ketoacid dehydrogenase subunit beta [Planctomycetota bacterium]MDP6368176.1 alpha-ketoacid dehydrogenase subunit beta [Planctomycetota bacterium]MDP6520923.1 alpha-ketoacid dehydrogenase subunit beta [Planctomycetota bacterium]
MTTRTLIQAVNDGLRSAMRADDSVLVFGEDVGPKGGVFLATEGLTEEFGEQRCFDTPLSEDGIIGTAVGMAMNGLRPVAEIQFQDFIFPAFDQIVSEAAKLRYRSGGQYSAPMVIRTPYGGGIRGGLYHSQSGEAYFCHTPGLKVVIPSTPADAKGLLLAAIADPDPVLFLEPKALYRTVKGDVPDDDQPVSLSSLRVVRQGSDVTVFCYGAMVPVASGAAEAAAEKGISVNVIDLRTLLPLDEEGVLAEARKTGRVVTVHEAPRFCGYGAEISALIAENAIEYMEAPVRRVAGFDTPFPNTLEHHYIPDQRRVLDAIEEVYNF